MNMNAVALAVLGVVGALHTRVYRNKTPSTPSYPFVLVTADSAVPSDPSSDLYISVDVVDDPNATVTAMEVLADTIQNALDDKIISNSAVNLHLTIEQRQYVSNTDLVTQQMVNLRFVCRAYFK